MIYKSYDENRSEDRISETLLDCCWQNGCYWGQWKWLISYSRIVRWVDNVIERDRPTVNVTVFFVARFFSFWLVLLCFFYFKETTNWALAHQMLHKQIKTLIAAAVPLAPLAWDVRNRGKTQPFTGGRGRGARTLRHRGDRVAASEVRVSWLDRV